jgi:signal transduction histidine kinase
VRDNGGGIRPDFLTRAFDRFTRADPARGGGGAGLGLAIVKTIADSHGGSVHLEKIEGAGTDAWLSLPDATHRERAVTDGQ